MRVSLSKEDRAQIFALFEHGLTPEYIGMKFGVHRTTVARITKRYMQSGSFEHKKGNGRPRKLSSCVLKDINEEIRKNPKKSLRKVSNSLMKNKNINLSHVSVRNALNSMNIFSYSSVKKPLLSKKNILARYEFAKEVIKTDIEATKEILFSDESKFELYNSKKKSFVWREPGTGLFSENILPTVKFGGISVMVWGCFSYAGVGKLVFIDGIMDSAMYCDILSSNLLASAKLLGIKNLVFQQDNDPKHTSKLTKSFLAENNIKTLVWPPQSPDMNPIENLWAIVKEKVAEIQPKNKVELKNAIIKAWNEITPKTTKKLVESYKKRALKLYRSKGNHIKY